MALHGKRERWVNDGLNPILHDYADCEGGDNPYSEDKARTYQPREFRCHRMPD